jgi:hypothetical protein
MKLGGSVSVLGACVYMGCMQQAINAHVSILVCIMDATVHG